jgi:hypothetical protein
MTTKRSGGFFTALGLCATLMLAGGAQASGLDVTYDISVNTSGIAPAGFSGYLDFELNPGSGTADPANATLTGFTTDGVLTDGLPSPPVPPQTALGSVSGSLPGTVTISNTGSVNDYTPGFTFGSFFDVFVELSVPNVSGTATSGNVFTLDMQDPGFNSLLTGGPPPPYALQINLDAATGLPTILNNAGSALTITAVTAVTAAPEPATWAFLPAGLIAFAILRRKTGLAQASRK